MRLYIYTAILITLLVRVAGAQAPMVEDPAVAITARVAVPAGVDPSKLTAYLHTSAPTSIENEWRPVTTTAVATDGTVTLVIPSVSVSQVEISGPGVRRARFALPTSNTPRAVFRMEKGESIDGVVTDAIGNPAGRALLGPIIPGADASPSTMKESYPFFVETDDGGAFRIDGLSPGTSYEIPVRAESYIRARFTAEAGAHGVEFKLAPGGLAITGSVVHESDLSPAAGVLVAVEGGEINVRQRTDPEGRFAVDGLPEGSWSVFARDEDNDLIRPVSIALIDGDPNPPRTIVLSDAARVSGQLVDGDTGAGIADAFLKLGDDFLRTDELGRFDFVALNGPWPKQFTLESDVYTLDAGETVDAREGNVSDFVLRAKRLRFLETIVTGVDQVAPQTFLTLHRVDETGLTRHALHDLYEATPLHAAGTRLAFASSASGTVSPITRVYTAVDVTTTTLELDLGPGATLEATLELMRSDGSVYSPEYKLSVQTTVDEVGAEWAFVSAEPGDTGAVRLKNLPPGRFKVLFERVGGGPVYTESLVELKRGEATRIDAKANEGGVLEGTVVDEKGQTVREIEITIFAKTPDGNPLRQQMQSREDGSFRFEGIGGDTVARVATNHHRHASFVREDVPLSEPLRIVLAERGVVTVKLDRVYTGAEAMLLQGIQNLAPDGSTQWFSQVAEKQMFDASGAAVLSPGAAGRYRVAAEAEGAWGISAAFDWDDASPAMDIALKPGETAEIDVALEGVTAEAMPNVEATLLNTTLPEGMATVEFQPLRQRSNLVYTTLPPGDYLLLASTPAGATATLSGIDLKAGEQKRLRVDLSEKSSRIDGKIISGDSPAAGASVAVRFADIPEGDVLTQSTADRSGAFSIDELPAGRPYLFEVSWNGVSGQFRSSSPADGGAWREEFTLAAPVKVALDLPPALRAKMEAAPAVPLVFVGEGGATMLRLENLETLALKPGTYRVDWGEESIGVATVPNSGGGKPVRVSVEMPRS